VVISIVFRPSPGPEFWPGHRVIRVNFFKKKSKWRRFSKKQKKPKSTDRNWVFDRVAGSAGSHQVVPSPIFSSTRPGSSPRSAESRVDLPSQAGFQNCGHKYIRSDLQPIIIVVPVLNVYELREVLKTVKGETNLFLYFKNIFEKNWNFFIFLL